MGQKIHGVSPGLPMMSAALSGVNGEVTPRPQMYVRPIVDDHFVVGFEARVDMPLSSVIVGACGPHAAPTDVAMAALHRAPVASQALVGACRGAARLGEESQFVDEDVLDRVEAIGCYVSGWSIGEIEEEFGPEHALAAHEVGRGFFKMLGRGLKKVALPLASKMVQFVPGVGPIASTALDQGMKIIDAASRGGKRRRHHRGSSSAPMVYQPSVAECARILAKAHGVVGEEEVGRFRFGKAFRHVLMPHTLLTDHLPKGARAVLDPAGALSHRMTRRKRRHRRHHHRGH